MSCQSIKIRNRNPEPYSIANKGQRLIPKDGVFYWHLVNFTQDMDKFRVIHAFELVFKEHLQPHFGSLMFKSTSDPNEAHFKIMFAQNGDNWLPEPFDLHTLAYAYFPGTSRTGESYFNDAYKWAMMNKSGDWNLVKVAVHEFLHNLNLNHSDDPKDILYYLNMPENVIRFTQDTIDGIHAIYGDLMTVDTEAVEMLRSIYYEPKRLYWCPNKKSLKAICDILKIDNTGRVKDLRDRINSVIHKT